MKLKASLLKSSLKCSRGVNQEDPLSIPGGQDSDALFFSDDPDSSELAKDHIP